jgi:nucleotide-binding universal stress UspA family protein
MFNRILLAADGSDHAIRAAAVAGDLASKYGAEVVVVHVIDRSRLDDAQERMAEVEHVGERGHGQYPWVANVPAELAAMLQPDEEPEQRQRMLEYLADRIVHASVERLHEHDVGHDRIRVVFKNGHPAKRILETAQEEKSDLIVMGSRGLSNFMGALEGSVSRRVTHGSDCSVITVK